MRPNPDFRQLVRSLLFSTAAGSPGDSQPGSSTFDIRNTNFFKILKANPSLARSYPDFSQHRSAKPSSNIDLDIESGIFADPDQVTKN
ncbi:MAG: hypothetical protein WCF22_00710, partial [Candidatus Sulfotelmatobacter sp.]